MAGTGRALGLDCSGVASSSAGGDSATRSRKRQAVALAAVLGGGARQAFYSSFRKRPARAAGQIGTWAKAPGQGRAYGIPRVFN